MFCNACGTEVPDGARFCQNCGAELVPAAGGTPAQTSTAVLPPPNPPTFIPPYDYAPPVYPPPPYPVVPGYAAAPTKSGKAIAGFWLGIVSIPCFVLSWVGVIIGILGLIFGLLGLSETRRLASTTGESPARFGYRQARIGIACAVIGILASAAFLVYLLNNLDKYGIKFTG
jgi:hypothetical protein